jgi:hypothetical protein
VRRGRRESALVAGVAGLASVAGLACGGPNRAAAGTHANQLAAPPCVVPTGSSASPRRVRGRPPASIYRALAVVRRARVASDRLPRGVALRTDGLRLIYAKYVRRVGVTTDGPFYLVPGMSQRPTLSEKCLRRLPAADQQRARRLVEAIAASPVICLDDFDSGGGDFCQPASALTAGRLLAFATSRSPAGSPTSALVTIAGLATDGVASVQALYPRQAPAAAVVTSNFYSFTHTVDVPANAQSFPNPLPDTMVFKDSGGRVLQQASIPPISPPAQSH